MAITPEMPIRPCAETHASRPSRATPKIMRMTPARLIETIENPNSARISETAPSVPGRITPGW